MHKKPSARYSSLRSFAREFFPNDVLRLNYKRIERPNLDATDMAISSLTTLRDAVNASMRSRGKMS